MPSTRSQTSSRGHEGELHALRTWAFRRESIAHIKRFVLVAMLATVGVMAETGRARAQAAAEESEMSEARALFMAGRVAFEEGRYDAALKHFSASYEQSQKPALLYNIAQCHDRLRQDEQAIVMFERYLELDPNAQNRPAVEARLAVLRSSLAERRVNRESPASEAKQVDAPASRDQPSEEPKQVAIGPWLAMGTGIALAASGAVLMTLAKANADDVENADEGSSYGALQSELDTAERRWLIGQGLVAVGLVSTCAGAVWWWLRRPEQHTSVRVGLGPQSLFVAGKF